jgi:hypothetical protein
MSISVNPVLPVAAAQSAAPDLLLQPGTVVDAQVLKLLSDNLVRIAIANLSIDVLSEVPLSAGQTLQLAVSQSEGGIRLAVVGQGAGAAAGLTSDSVTLAPEALLDVAANTAISITPSKNVLTPLERVAVAAAAQTAATQQGSLAPLFANLDAVAGSNNLPPKLQQAVMQVLAQQTSLDQNLTGSEIKNAFQKSGLFLEASLASGSVPSGSGVPDLKAALIVLRQALLSSLGTAGATAGTATSPATSPTVSGTDAAASLHPTASPTLVPSPAADAGVQEALLPQAGAQQTPLPHADAQETLPPQAGALIADAALETGHAGRIVLTATPLDAKSTAGAVLNLLQEAVQDIPRQLGHTSLVTGTLRDLRGDDVTVHTNTPPPPFRGAQPSAQPIASPSIAANAPLETNAHHLLGDTDAAIARQTLLQVASLPDRLEPSGLRLDPAAPRWNFEIPFVTPQGTAVAQFEISRDGGGREIEAAKRVWRARFSLDIEPAGPIHALVSLTGERTSVRMWAERPATAARLRDGAAQLSQALSKAELQPGDIVIRDGAPPQSQPAPAGHFLDRAL